MLRDLLTQIAWNKKMLLILDTPKYVDLENIGRRTFLYQLLKKCDLQL
jgi:hypothetical protein